MSALRCECGAEAVVIFQPDPSCVWGVCLDCAATSHHGATMHRLAQGLCGAALAEGMLWERLRRVMKERDGLAAALNQVAVEQDVCDRHDEGIRIELVRLRAQCESLTTGLAAAKSEIARRDQVVADLSEAMVRLDERAETYREERDSARSEMDYALRKAWTE